MDNNQWRRQGRKQEKEKREKWIEEYWEFFKNYFMFPFLQGMMFGLGQYGTRLVIAVIANKKQISWKQIATHFNLK